MNVLPFPSLTRQITSTSAEVLALSRKRYGRRREREAWADFFGSAPPPYEESLLFQEIFLPWYLYSWGPAPVAGQFADALPGPAARPFVRAALGTPYSFHRVERVRPGHALLLHDLLDGKRGWVLEQSGTRTLADGDVVFSKVVEVFRLRFLLGTASTVIPETYLPEIRRVGRAPEVHSRELRRIDLYYSVLGEILAREAEALPSP